MLVIIRDILNMSISNAILISLYIGYIASFYSKKINIMIYLMWLLAYEIVIYIIYTLIKRKYSIMFRIKINIAYKAGYIFGRILKNHQSITPNTFS